MFIRAFEPSRAVEVIASQYGSGYRIGGRLVLTASHLLGKEGTECIVKNKNGFEDKQAKVVWKAPNDTDIALIELSEESEGLKSIALGKMPEGKAGENISFQMYGYPRWGWIEGDQRPSSSGLQVEGKIYLADTPPLVLRIDENLVSEYLANKIIKEIKEDYSLELKSEWVAMSGAAVVCDGLVVGVQKQHSRPMQPNYVAATPLWIVYDNEQWRNLLKQNGINPQPAMVRLKTSSRDDEKTEQPKYEKRLLEYLRNEAQFGNALITLNLKTQPNLVLCRQLGDTKINPIFSKDLPSGTKILSVFKQEKGKLLILGEPGSGKSTILGELFQDLLNIAEVNLDYPIPVLFTLSSWREKLSIEDLMIEQLKLMYPNLGKYASTLVKERRILPLLDGLDEVKSDRELCVKAINQLLRGESSPQYLVVSSRREEYEKVFLGEWEQEISELQDERRLHLNNAILLKTLTVEQIQSYLISKNKTELWITIQQDSELLNLVTIPLFLSLVQFILPDGEFSLDSWRNLTSSEARQQYLFDIFWDVATKRKLVGADLLEQGIKSKTYGKRKIPTLIQTEKWLAWLAKNLEQESKTIFLIEQLQPTRLENGFQKQGYLLIYAFITIIFSNLPLTFGLFFGGEIDFIVILVLYILLFLVATTTASKITVKLRPKFSWKVLQVGARTALGYALFIVVWIGLNFGITRGIIVALSSGLIIGIIGTVIFYAYLTFVSTDLEENVVVVRPNQGIKRLRDSTLTWTAIGLLLGIVLPLLFILRELASYMLKPGSSEEGMLLAILFGLGFLPDPITGAGMGLLIGLLVGGLDSLKHFALRCILCWTGKMPWNYAQFLDYCTERLFLQKVGGRYKFIHNLFQKYVAQRKGVDEVNSSITNDVVRSPIL
jgi:GTPase SAR1 family protein